MRFMRALFETQFEPHDGGYVFYPTVWSGGRPVSAAEFDAMRRQNARITAFIHSWRGLVLLMAGTVGFSLASGALDPSRVHHVLAVTAFIMAVTLGSIWGPWLAPARIVRGRKAVKPARDRRVRLEAQREVRAAMRGPSLVFAAIFVAMALAYLFVR